MDTSFLRSRAPVMQSLHPADEDLKLALIPVIVAVVLLYVSFEWGHWDKFFVETVDWIVNGVMGLWGE